MPTGDATIQTRTAPGGTFAIGETDVLGSPAPTPAPSVGLFPFLPIGGLTTMYVLVATGACIITQHKWDVDDALDLIEPEKITAIAGVPTVVRALLAHPYAPNRDLSSLPGQRLRAHRDDVSGRRQHRRDVLLAQRLGR
jgi:long-chain acyl-CoA synthetase